MCFLSPAEPCTVSGALQVLSNEMVFSMFDFVLLFHNPLDNFEGGGEGSSTFSCKEEE